MKTSSIAVIVEISLVLVALVLWFYPTTLTDESIVIPKKWHPGCDPAQFGDFIANISESKKYRVMNEHGPNGTLYHNAIVRLIMSYDNISAFLAFTCHTPNVMTCDLYSIWKDGLGEIRSQRNVETSFANRPNEYYLRLDKFSKSYTICDPQKRLFAGFRLAPIDEMDQGGNICSANYKYHFNEKQCSDKTLEHRLEVGDDGGVRGLMVDSNSKHYFGNKPQTMPRKSKNEVLIYVSVVLAAVVGIVMTVKQLVKCFVKYL